MEAVAPVGLWSGGPGWLFAEVVLEEGTGIASKVSKNQVNKTV